MRYVSGLAVAVPMLMLGCADTSTSQEYPDAVAADPDHYSVEFENDVVRLLRIQYAPGAESVMHRHPANCSVALSESSWGGSDPEGSVTETTNSFGEVGCGEGNVHSPENVGSVPGEVLLIEFKEGGVQGTETMEEPDAVTADSDHYSVEFENEVARVVRIRYEPGDTGVAHSHPANCTVWLSNPVTEGEGETRATGDVECSEAQVHTPSGSDDGPIELVAIEFKGRGTLQN
jgi:quercetin dioxygenase-like cupin family protein